MTGVRSQAAGPRIADGWPTAFWLWLTNPYDYLWIVHHHSMRPLNRQLRFALAAATSMMALGSVLALLSSRGPRRARAYFVGLLIFGDLGVAAVMLTLPPLDGAFGTVLLALTSTICVYFVSSRAGWSHT